MEKVLIIDTDKCTGCRVCELACSITKHNEFIPSKSYIMVMKNKDMDISIVALGIKCDFCGECTEWCPPKALQFISLEEATIKWKGTKVGSLPAPLISSF